MQHETEKHKHAKGNDINKCKYYLQAEAQKPRKILHMNKKIEEKRGHKDP